MVPAAIQLCVMASEKSCKRKTREVSDSSEQVLIETNALNSFPEVVLDYVIDPLDSYAEIGLHSAEIGLDSPSEASEISKDLQLLSVRTRPISTCRGSSDTEKKDGGEMEDEDDQAFLTPKGEESKIGEITICPPAPRKPKSIPRKRNHATASRALFIPYDSPDLEEFIANHCENSKKKQKVRESKGNDLSI